MRKAGIFDCDDVLLDYISGIRAFVKKHHNVELSSRPTSYNFGRWMDIPWHEADEILRSFNYHSYEFGLLQPIENDINETMKVLTSMSDLDLFVLTKSGTLGHSQVLRKVNLMNVFGDIFKDIIMIEPHESKYYQLSKLKQTYDVRFFVDDNMDNIEAGVALDIPSFLYNQSHNEFEHYKNRFDTVKDMIPSILETLK